MLINIIENTLIPHNEFKKIIKALKNLYDMTEHSIEPSCIALIAESRSGKTRTIEEAFYEYEPYRDKKGLNVPILKIISPTNPTIIGLIEIMLIVLGDKLFDKGTLNTKTARLKILIEECGTRLIVIDEFQHFYDKDRNKVVPFVSDWLKSLVEDINISLIVAGLDTCKFVIMQNEQLLGRFEAPLILPRFDWSNEYLKEEFKGILNAYYISLSEHFEICELGNSEMSFRCYCASGGIIGYVAKILKKAVRNAISNNSKTISLSDLDLAHKQAVWDITNANNLNPFSSDFYNSINGVDTPEVMELCEKAKQIGVPLEKNVQSKRRKAIVKTTLPMNTVLSGS